jgi:WD40 repeat protein/energy-coupling factor transporter ATP-binding protein EcfA2
LQSFCTVSRLSQYIWLDWGHFADFYVSTPMSRYALVIGIAEYTGSFKSLETPVNNANAIADLLDQYGKFDQVRRLPSRRERGQKDLGEVIKKSLTDEELTRELQQFLQDADGSEVLIYFSGHGFTRFDKLSGEKEGFLATSNCQVEQDAEKRIITAKNAISLYSLNTLIKQHKFNSLVVILDCCNAGAFVESAMVRRDVTAFGYEWDHYFITACRGSSKAYEGENHSLLTQAILKGLAPGNASRSGRISGDGLFNVVGEELNNSRQEPLRMGWGRGITLVQYHNLPLNSQEAAKPEFDPANPYVGLKAFELDQADYFHGRERAVRALLDRLNENRFLAVIGPSGCGKSSLVKAGLLPELEADRIPGSHNWIVVSFTPGRDPLTVLSDAFSHPPVVDQTIVLFIDQFEELFTLCDNEEVQRQFIKRLHEATSKLDQRTRVILTMRGDFLDRCAKFQESADLINTQVPTTYVVTPLTGRELAEAIAQPALMHKATFEDGLVDKILEDVADQQGALPLLQYALFELWKGCIDGTPTPHTPHPTPQLTLSSYTEIGGVKGALQRRANQLYQEGFTESERSLFWELMRELVEVSEEKATRRRANRSQLPNSLLQIARKLADQRLLMIDNATVEVAHEALLSEWSLLRDWIEENRDNIHLSRCLELDCNEWLEKSQSNDYLLTGGRLSAIEEWVEKNQPNLPDLQIEFLKKSLERRDKELQTQLDQERKLREEAEARAKESGARAKAEKYKTIATATAGIFVISTLIVGLLAQQRGVKVKQSEAFGVGALIEEAKQSFDGGYQLEAMVKAVKALKKLEQTDVDQLYPLKELQNLVYKVQERNRLKYGTLEMRSFDISPDEDTIASASFDGIITLWTKNGRFIKAIQVGSAVYGVAFSPDGQTIASASEDGIIRLWTKHGFLINAFKERHIKYASRVIFSLNGKILISASKDGTIKLWRKNDGVLLKNISVGSPVYGLRFSPTEQIFASIGEDGVLRFWNLNGTLIGQKKVSHNPAGDMSFSFDGQTIAVASDDRTIKLWKRGGSWKKMKFLRVIKGHEAPVYNVDFSRDNIIASGGSSDEKLKLWRKDGSLIKTLDCHSYINYVRFSPDGKTVICATDNRSLILWDVENGFIRDSSLQELITHGCNRLHEYFKTNPNSENSEVCSSK